MKVTFKDGSTKLSFSAIGSPLAEKIAQNPEDVASIEIFYTDGMRGASTSNDIKRIISLLNEPKK